MAWNEVIRSIENSRKLLQALWEQDEKAVTEGIDQAHGEISVLQYNNENSLSCTIALAFYFAREYYHVIRELPTDKGFADICLIPRKKYAQKPATIIELKWDKSAKGAIAQIKEKNIQRHWKIIMEIFCWLVSITIRKTENTLAKLRN